MEHYQFSFRNYEFLWNAAQTTGVKFLLFGFCRTLGAPGPPTRAAALVFQTILGRSRPVTGRLHRECGRTAICHPFCPTICHLGRIRTMLLATGQ